MSALAAARNTQERQGDVLDFPVGAAKTIYQGGLVVLDAGYAEPGNVDTDLIAVGRAEETVDNSAGSAGDLNVRVRRGIFKYANSASTDLIAQANVGADCYIVDDCTVAKTDGSSARSRAGKIVAVDSDGVWVQVGLGV